MTNRVYEGCIYVIVSIIMLICVVLITSCATTQNWKSVDVPTVKIVSVTRVNASANSLGVPVAEVVVSNPYDTVVSANLICHSEDNELIGRTEEKLKLPAQSDTKRRLMMWDEGITICYLEL
jgi:hypothetical protein